MIKGELTAPVKVLELCLKNNNLCKNIIFGTRKAVWLCVLSSGYMFKLMVICFIKRVN